MTHDDLPLLNWQPPHKIIPFPAILRQGHAKKVALQLKKARTHREADRFLCRAMDTFVSQLGKIGISADTIERQRVDYLHMIHGECCRVGSAWCPDLAPCGEGHGDHGGAA